MTNIGDNDVTLTVGTSTETNSFDDPLTANRTVTLSTTGSASGDQFRILKIRTDPFSVDIGPGLYTIHKNEGASVLVEFDGANWILKRSSRI